MTRSSDAHSGRWLGTLAAGASIGVDIGGSAARAVRLDPAGRQVRSVSRPMTAKGPEGTLAAAVDITQRLLTIDGGDDVAGIGVGVPGVIDADGVVRCAGNLAIGQQPLALRDRMAEALGLPVAVDNDMRVAALGARRHFAAELPRHHGTLVYLGIGTGISVGVVQDGRLVRGRDGMAGEVGHMVFEPDGPACHCGSRGCLEALAAGPAFASAWPHAERQPARALLAAAAGGDTSAQAIADRLVGYLARVVQWLMVVHAPDLLVLGGGVGSIGEALLDPIRRRIEDVGERSPLMAEIASGQRLRFAPPDVPLGAIGAAMLASAGRG